MALDPFKKEIPCYTVKEEGIRIGEKRGKKEGLAAGKAQGMNAKAIASAKNLLAMKVLSHEQIAQAVELPIEKIEELAAEMAK